MWNYARGNGGAQLVCTGPGSDVCVCVRARFVSSWHVTKQLRWKLPHVPWVQVRRLCWQSHWPSWMLSQSTAWAFSLTTVLYGVAVLQAGAQYKCWHCPLVCAYFRPDVFPYHALQLEVGSADGIPEPWRWDVWLMCAPLTAYWIPMASIAMCCVDTCVAIVQKKHICWWQFGGLVARYALRIVLGQKEPQHIPSKLNTF